LEAEVNCNFGEKIVCFEQEEAVCVSGAFFQCTWKKVLVYERDKELCGRSRLKAMSLVMEEWRNSSGGYIF